VKTFVLQVEMNLFRSGMLSTSIFVTFVVYMDQAICCASVTVLHLRANLTSLSTLHNGDIQPD